MNSILSRALGALAGGAVVAFAALCTLPAARAADTGAYPNHPIRIIVPFSPGGAVDGPTRLIAKELAKRLSQGVVVENKPGAGATIGADIVAKAPPDGYTLLLASQTNAISATLYSKLPYDAVRDFEPISLIAREPGIVVVNPKVPARTLQAFIAYVKARPGKIDFASSGNGSGQHLFAALLASKTGMKMNHVPYRGSAQGTTDLLAGRVQMSIPGIAGMMGHIRDGKLRPLAVTGAHRSPLLPDVPTVEESGVPDYEAYVWMGLFAPKGTPKPIIDLLHEELVASLATDEVKRYFASVGTEIVGSTPAEFGAYFVAQKKLWAKVIQETGARID
ncbi:MAG: tripartite tricarboxylate transporter substrate binding protein [Betaproteobacteria bacterium]|nr:tripartite tricarboxylate transporter substrate binding protein [Betaproteobacteria bacterium]MDE2002353.1 tripartite tricarboxylate transporter substrate binding protein [Betaproteobacteria bacterium]MDE2208337.1 tripartite tricarboxylate transporter substrate binding protein [Betaproteobacteria bacterium]